MKTYAYANCLGINNRLWSPLIKKPAKMFTGEFKENSYECVRATNLDIDDSNSLQLRAGRELVDADPCHSLYSDGTRNYGVWSDKLCLVGDDFVRTDLGVTAGQVEYCQAGSFLVYTDGTVIGTLDATAHVLPTPTLPYKIAMPAGTSPTYYRGRLFVIVPDGIRMSDPTSPLRTDERRGFIPLKGVRFLAPTIDGIYAATDKATYFLKGEGKFEKIPVATYGAIPRTLAFANGAKIKDGYPHPIPVWCGTTGVCLGLPNGQIQNITATKYLMPQASSGAGVVREAENLWYHASVDDRIITVNLNHFAVSEYDFTVDSFAVIGESIYAASATGLQKLFTGVADFAASIVGILDIGTHDFDDTFIHTIADCWLNGWFPAGLTLAVQVDEQAESVYDILSNSDADNLKLSNHRVKLALGVKGRNWNFVVSNPTGAFFRLEEFSCNVHSLARHS